MRVSTWFRFVGYSVSSWWLCGLLVACDMGPPPEKSVELAPVGLFSAALSPHYALLGTTAGRAELWQIDPKSLLHVWQHTDEHNGIVYAAIADDERYAVTAERESLAWWRIADGKLLGVWRFPAIHALALSSDGRHALVGLPDRAIYFSLASGATRYAFQHDARVTAVALDARGQFALTGDEQGRAHLWRLQDGQKLFSWSHHGEISAATLNDDGSIAMTHPMLGKTHLWKTTNGRLLHTLGHYRVTVAAARFAKNGRYLATGLVSGQLQIWEAKSGALLQNLQPLQNPLWRAPSASVLAVSFALEDRKLYSITSNGGLQRWRR